MQYAPPAHSCTGNFFAALLIDHLAAISKQLSGATCRATNHKPSVYITPELDLCARIQLAMQSSHGRVGYLQTRELDCRECRDCHSRILNIVEANERDVSRNVHACFGEYMKQSNRFATARKVGDA